MIRLPDDPASRAILDARAEALARPAGADHGSAADDLLVVRAGGSLFALPMRAVRAIEPRPPLGRLPGAAPPVLGLCRMTGRLAALVDLAGLAGLAPEAVPGGGHAVLLRRSPPTALAVARVVSVGRALPGAGDPDPGATVRPVRIAGLGDGRDAVALIDLDRLLAPLARPPAGA